MITLEEFKKKHSDKCRLIGLDLGSKRIGVSICDDKQLIATPLKTINRNSLKDLVDELRLIVDENDIKGINLKGLNIIIFTIKILKNDLFIFSLEFN